MPITEIFPNPTVKQVNFQIVFPNLFYLENKIGEFQLKVMKQFPQSSLLYRGQFLFAEVGPSVKAEDVRKMAGDERGEKIWQFTTNNKDVELNIQSNSLHIMSKHHKTYNLSGGEKFRDVIKSVVDSFLETVQIPVMSRIGLRYIDECPLPSKDNSTFKSYYNSAFPVDRFDLSAAIEMDFKTAVKVGDHYLRYVESLRRSQDKYVLILDFDGYATNITAADYLTVLDSLHDIISAEFEKTIKGPVYEYMRSTGGTE